MENKEVDCKLLRQEKNGYREEILRLAYSIAFYKQDENSLQNYRKALVQCFQNINLIEKKLQEDKSRKDEEKKRRKETRRRACGN